MPSHLSNEQLENIFALLKEVGATINLPLNSLMGLLEKLAIGPYGLFKMYSEYMRQQEATENKGYQKNLLEKRASINTGNVENDIRMLVMFENALLGDMPTSIFPSLIERLEDDNTPVFRRDRWFAKLLTGQQYGSENDLDSEEKRHLRELIENDQTSQAQKEEEFLSYLTKVFRRTEKVKMQQDTMGRCLVALAQNNFEELGRLFDKFWLKKELTATEKKHCYELLVENKFEELSKYIKIDMLSFIFLTYSTSKGEGNGRTIRGTLAHLVLEEWINKKDLELSEAEQQQIDLIRQVCSVYGAIVSLRTNVKLISRSSNKPPIADSFQSPRVHREGVSPLFAASASTNHADVSSSPASSPTGVRLLFSPLRLSQSLKSDQSHSSADLETNIAALFRLLSGVLHHLHVTKNMLLSQEKDLAFSDCISTIGVTISAIDAWLRRLCLLVQPQVLIESNVPYYPLDRVLRMETCQHEQEEILFRHSLNELYGEQKDTMELFFPDEMQGLIFNPEIMADKRWRFFQDFCANSLIYLQQLKFNPDAIDTVLNAGVVWVKQEQEEKMKEKVDKLYNAAKGVIRSPQQEEKITALSANVSVKVPVIPTAPSSPSKKK